MDKLKVGICYTKYERSPHPIYKEFINGLNQYGDQYTDIVEWDKEWKDKLKGCDLSMQVCEGHKLNQDGTTRGNAFRSHIREFQNKHKKRRLVFEAGFVKNDKMSDTPKNEGYFQLGYDGMKRVAKCYNNNSPDDRWKMLGVSEKPWRKDGSHILILAQNISGPGCSHIDIVKWWEKTIVKLRKATDRPIKIRPHPTVNLSIHPNNILLKKFECKEKSVSILEQGVDIQADFEDCWCAVALTTNSAVDAIINGIPVITPDPMSMAYGVASHEIEEVNNPATPDRTQWLYDLAYSQWSLSEIGAGIPWARLRGFALN